LFGGAAKENTETFAGQLDILKERFGEIQEDIGAKLIPKLKDLLENVNLVAKGFSGEDKDGLSARARELQNFTGNTGASSLGGSLKTLADSFGKLFGALTGSDAEGSSDTLTKIANALEAVANGIIAITEAYKKAKGFGSKLLDTLVIGEGKAGFSSGAPSLPNTFRKDKVSAVGGTTININGAVDANGTRRQIEQLMRTSSRDMGPVTLNGARL
jgi:hypothetical protein